jgi:hypothetical protein
MSWAKHQRNVSSSNFTINYTQGTAGTRTSSVYHTWGSPELGDEHYISHSMIRVAINNCQKDLRRKAQKIPLALMEGYYWEYSNKQVTDFLLTRLNSIEVSKIMLNIAMRRRK